jgi:hypothetical protein
MPTKDTHDGRYVYCVANSGKMARQTDDFELGLFGAQRQSSEVADIAGRG